MSIWEELQGPQNTGTLGGPPASGILEVGGMSLPLQNHAHAWVQTTAPS